MLLFENNDRIVFTGDSVTDSGRGRPVGQGLWDGVGNGYVRAIDSLLAVSYPESLFHIMNTGSSGFTSRDLLSVLGVGLHRLQRRMAPVRFPRRHRSACIHRRIREKRDPDGRKDASVCKGHDIADTLLHRDEHG